tara:strand:- start:1393 stop:1623 length:231 start_codon:yes stop_codon:yes gene_type:complete
MSNKMIQIPLPFEEPMDDFTAIGIAEGFLPCGDKEQYLKAWQHLIDTGLAWRLQGSFGRQATHMIEEGHCTPPKGV